MINKVSVSPFHSQFHWFIADTDLLLAEFIYVSHIFKDFEEYPEHRTNFFILLQAVNSHCFAGMYMLETIVSSCEKSTFISKWYEVIMPGCFCSIPGYSTSTIQVSTGFCNLGFQAHNA